VGAVAAADGDVEGLAYVPSAWHDRGVSVPDTSPLKPAPVEAPTQHPAGADLSGELSVDEIGRVKELYERLFPPPEFGMRLEGRSLEIANALARIMPGIVKADGPSVAIAAISLRMAEFANRALEQAIAENADPDLITRIAKERRSEANVALKTVAALCGPELADLRSKRIGPKEMRRRIREELLIDLSPILERSTP
jgi:hypothetical protein